MAVAVSQGVNFDATCFSRDSVGEHRRRRLNKNGLAIVPPGSILSIWFLAYMYTLRSRSSRCTA